MDGPRLFAYCEVKSPRDEWLDNQLDGASPGEIVGGCRKDPTFNRLSKMIESAIKQFDAVNPDRSVPNILVFLNHDDGSHAGDMFETLTGRFLADDGTQHLTIPHVSHGRIREAKHRIDLYIWIEAKAQGPTAYVFSESLPVHVDVLCQKLGLDKAKIQRGDPKYAEYRT